MQGGQQQQLQRRPQKKDEEQFAGNVFKVFNRIWVGKWVLFVFVLLIAPLLSVCYVIFHAAQGVFPYEYEGFVMLFYMACLHFVLCLFDVGYTSYKNYISASFSSKSKLSYLVFPLWMYIFLLAYLSGVLNLGKITPENIFKAAPTNNMNYLYFFLATVLIFVMGFLGLVFYNQPEDGGGSIIAPRTSWMNWFRELLVYHAPVVFAILFSYNLYFILFEADASHKDSSLQLTTPLLGCAFLGLFVYFALSIACGYASYNTLFYAKNTLVISAYVLLIYAIAFVISTFHGLEKYFNARVQEDGIVDSPGNLNKLKVTFYHDFIDQTYMHEVKLMSAGLVFALFILNFLINYYFLELNVLSGLTSWLSSAHGEGAAAAAASAPSVFRQNMPYFFILCFYFFTMVCWITFSRNLASFLQTIVIGAPVACALAGFIYFVIAKTSPETFAKMKYVEWATVMLSLLNLAIISAPIEKAYRLRNKKQKQHQEDMSMSYLVIFGIPVLGFSAFLISQAAFLRLSHNSSTSIGQVFLQPWSILGGVQVGMLVKKVNDWLLMIFGVNEVVLMSFAVSCYNFLLAYKVLRNSFNDPVREDNTYALVMKGEEVMFAHNAAVAADVPSAAVTAISPQNPFSVKNYVSYPYAQDNPQKPPPTPK